jgi:micrococcal nuclease
MNDWLYHYAATVLKVVDGDTIDIRIELGLNVSTVERCRLYGIDAPETRGESRQAGLESKQWLEDNLPEKIFIKTHRDKTGKYGRYLIDVFFDGDEELSGSGWTVQDEMVERKLAVRREY